MPDDKPDDFQRWMARELAQEMAKLAPPAQPAGAAPPQPITVELAALELAWRLLPPVLNLPGAIAQRAAWTDHAEFLARYLRKRLGLIETAPPVA